MFTWKNISVALQVIFFGGILAAMFTNCSSIEKERERDRPKGTSKFLYKVGDCSVYRIMDGNLENPALMTRCSKSTTVTEIQRHGNGENTKAMEVTNTIIEE